MNTSNNQRFQETDHRIKEAMLALIQQKEFKKITVNDICSRCGINRSTFYAHFIDTYDLIEKMQLDIYQDVTDSFRNNPIEPSPANAQKYNRVIFEHMRRNRMFYRVYLNNQNPELLEKAALVRDAFITPYMKALGVTSEREINYRFQFFWSGFLEVARIWVNDGCIESPEEMVEIIWSALRGMPD